MSNVIGMLVLVDSVTLMKDYKLQNLIGPESGEKKGNIPLFTWYDEGDNCPYIYMVADRRYVVAGQGTRNLTVKVSPGDEIRWWEANIYYNSPFSVMIKEISPPINKDVKWQAFFQHSPKLHPNTEREDFSTVGLSDRDLFWAAAFSGFRYQTKVKEDILLNNTQINLDYHIDLQVINKTESSKSPMCIFRWYPKIQLQEAS